MKSQFAKESDEVTAKVMQPTLASFMEWLTHHLHYAIRILISNGPTAASDFIGQCKNVVSTANDKDLDGFAVRTSHDPHGQINT